MNIEVYADGSATTQGNAGGWASVILVDGVVHKELYGHLESATNNDAELIAAIQGLKYTDQTFGDQIAVVTLISDSQIILNWASGKFRFKQLNKMDMYHELRGLVSRLKVQTKWVKGHSGDVYNSRCDLLANMARKNVQGISNGNTVTVPNDSKIGTKKNNTASLWYKGKLMVLDFDLGVIECYNREIHGKRGSPIEIRESKER